AAKSPVPSKQITMFLGTYYDKRFGPGRPAQSCLSRGADVRGHVRADMTLDERLQLLHLFIGNPDLAVDLDRRLGRRVPSRRAHPKHMSERIGEIEATE